MDTDYLSDIRSGLYVYLTVMQMLPFCKKPQIFLILYHVMNSEKQNGLRTWAMKMNSVSSNVGATVCI